MSEYVAGYKLTQYELDLERGAGADPSIVKIQADLISDKWVSNGEQLKPQVLLMLGGFQGSGKTTTLNFLVKSTGLLVISPDEIRQNLFSQKYAFSDDFIKHVSATKFELVRRALSQGYSLAIDQSIHPDGIKITEEATGIRPVSIFLTAPTEVLRERVSERPQLEGKYNGTVAELEASMSRYSDRYGDPLTGGYDLIINTVDNDPRAAAELIKSYLFKR